MKEDKMAWKKRVMPITFLIGKPEQKRSLWRPEHTQEECLKMDVKGNHDMDWIHAGNDRALLRKVVAPRIPLNTGNILTR